MEGNQAHSRVAATLLHILLSVLEISLMPGYDFLAPSPLGWGCYGRVQFSLPGLMVGLYSSINL